MSEGKREGEGGEGNKHQKLPRESEPMKGKTGRRTKNERTKKEGKREREKESPTCCCFLTRASKIAGGASEQCCSGPCVAR